MKKVLALALATVMLLTCFVITVSADDEKHETYVFRPNDSAETRFIEDDEADITAGWNGWCRYADGGNHIIYSYPALNLANATKVTWTCNIGQHIKLQVSQDKKTWKDVYVCTTEMSSADFHGDPYEVREFDLTSFLDKNGAKKIYIKVGDSFPSDGWGGAVTNRADVVLDIAYTGETVNTAGTIPVSDSIKSIELSPGTITTGGFMFTISSDPVDISGMKYIAFDLFIGYRTDKDGKVLDLEAMKAVEQFNLELTSAGKPDNNENSVIFQLTDYVKKLASGWNAIKIPISDMNISSIDPNDGGVNKTAWNFLRLFNISSLNVAEDLEVEDSDTHEMKTEKFDVKIGNVRFLDSTFDDAPVVVITGEHEIYDFIIEAKPADDKTPGESEALYFVETTAGWNGEQRFSDATGHTIYKYKIKNYFSVKKVTWTAKTSAQLLLRVSNDGQNWKEVYRYENEAVADGTQQNAGLPAKVRDYDITEYMDFSNSDEIWISIEDSYPANGWGGSIHKGEPCILDVVYEVLSDEELDAIEMTATEHSLPIWGCNSKWGDFSVDKENATAGSACTTVTISSGHAPQIALPQAYDGTGKDTLEFELYVSDLAFFDFGDKTQEKHFSNSWLELTSSGKYDDEEIAWDPPTIRNYIVGEPQVGWNHVALPLDTGVASGANAFRLNNVNFIRFFFVGPPEEAQGIVVKVDNFRLTDAQAVAYAAAVEEAAGFVEKASALTFLTVESITSKEDLSAAKKAFNAAERLYKKLSDAAKATVAQEVMDKYNAAEYAIDNYSETPNNNETTSDPGEETSGTPSGNEETSKPAETTKETEKEKSKGCGSVVSGALLLVGAIAGAGILVIRKKED